MRARVPLHSMVSRLPQSRGFGSASWARSLAHRAHAVVPTCHLTKCFVTEASGSATSSLRLSHRGASRHPTLLTSAIGSAAHNTSAPGSTRTLSRAGPIAVHTANGHGEAIRTFTSTERNLAGPVLYEVNLTFRDAEMQEKFENWLKDDHVAKVLFMNYCLHV